MEYSVTFEYLCTIFNDQVTIIGISITSTMYHFFVLGPVVPHSYFEVFN